MIPVIHGFVRSPEVRLLRVISPIDTSRGRRLDNGAGGGREGGEQ